jgi:hypothetical protein
MKSTLWNHAKESLKFYQIAIESLELLGVKQELECLKAMVQNS